MTGPIKAHMLNPCQTQVQVAMGGVQIHCFDLYGSTTPESTGCRETQEDAQTVTLHSQGEYVQLPDLNTTVF